METRKKIDKEPIIYINSLSVFFFASFFFYYCEQVFFVHVLTLIPPRLSDPRNFITVPLVIREPEQTTLLFWSIACSVTPLGLHTADRR